MHLISYPGQVCLVRPGWYGKCVAVVQQASRRGPIQPLCSAHVWLWFRERDMIDSPDGALQLFSYSVQCGSRSPCRCCRMWVCIRPHAGRGSCPRWSTHACMPKHTGLCVPYVLSPMDMLAYTHINKCGAHLKVFRHHIHTHRWIGLYDHVDITTSFWEMICFIVGRENCFSLGCGFTQYAK